MECGGEVVKDSRRKVAARQTGDEDVQHDGFTKSTAVSSRQLQKWKVLYW